MLECRMECRGGGEWSSGVNGSTPNIITPQRLNTLTIRFFWHLTMLFT